VNLPAAAGGQSIQLKWRCGTDNANSRPGWRIDSLGIIGRTCCSAASSPEVLLDSTTLAAESCAPTNNAIDPGETVSVLFALKNTGSVDTTNLIVTLLETNGVASPSGPQTYGALAGGAGPVAQPFTFTAAGTCGGTINATLQLTDGTANLGTLSVLFPLGQADTIFAESFDGVTAPALPAGWTYSATGYQSNWVTQASVRDSPPNAAFSPDVTNIGVNELVSPTILLPANPAQLTFRNNYDLEDDKQFLTNAFDGAVLEIRIGAGAFTDILAAGGSFSSGGYTDTIDTRYGNPLAGRRAWSGNSGGFITTTVNLPATAAGQAIQLRWRCGTDNSNGRTGWRIDTISVKALVCCANGPPVLGSQPDQTVDELTTLMVTNTASDSASPPRPLTYQLLSAPAGASISTNGVITWTPTEAQGPSTNVITTVASDNWTPPLSATNTFTIFVNEINSPPVLPIQTNLTSSGLTPVVVTNTASDSDIPLNTLSYQLTAAPAGAVIDTNGVISWTPTAASVPSTNLFITVVTDWNPWAVNSQHLSATNAFTVIISPVHNGPVLADQTNRSVNELTLLTVTNTASDSDLPARSLVYSLISPPDGAVIDTNGVITWTPSEAQGPSTNLIQTVVADDGTPSLRATNSFAVVVYEVNSAPVLPPQPDQTVVGASTLIVTNTATDSDIPINHLTYQLVGSPTTAVIDTNGVITWTPAAEQVPSTNLFTTIVTDDGVPPLSATNFFTVFVQSTTITSPPLIQSFSLSNGIATVVWTAFAGQNYRLQYQAVLGDTNWSDVSPDITATAASAAATNSLDGSLQRFYRVLLLP
jgi:hypothetical protein